uniref:Uncharacterized protein n=1 Tax=Arundo donax TaxID=35708 RepID=A0A0A8YQY6_ARUDO
MPNEAIFLTPKNHNFNGSNPTVRSDVYTVYTSYILYK